MLSLWSNMADIHDTQDVGAMLDLLVLFIMTKGSEFFFVIGSNYQQSLDAGFHL